MYYIEKCISGLSRMNSQDSCIGNFNYHVFPIFLFFIFLLTGLVFTVIFLTKRKAKVTVDVVLLKAVSSVLFVISASAALSLFLIANDTVYGYRIFSLPFVVVGLCFGMLGDIWLDLKYVYKPGEKKFLYAGFISFLIGHIFYSVFIYLNVGLSAVSVLVFLAGFIAVSVFTSTTEKLLKVKYGDSKKITVIYMGVLGGTLAVSGYSAIVAPTACSVLFFIGMVFFIASDALLAGIYFGIDEKARKNRVSIVLNHALYYIAQYLIAVSLFFYR